MAFFVSCPRGEKKKSADKRRRSAERTRGGGGLQHDVRRRDNQPEAPALAKSARPPSSLTTHSHRCCRRPRWTSGAPFWWQRRPLQSSCGCSDRCGGWCDEKLTSVIRNYDHRWLWLSEFGIPPRQRWRDLFDSNSTICKYIFT